MTGGQQTVMKPSRSDDVLDADEQLLITNRARAQIESMMPRRPIKPNRSEPDSTSPPIPDEDIHIPELNKLKSLQSQSQPIFSGPKSVDQDEFVETQYYKELESIDKQHHTTGNGFIKTAMEKSGNEYDLQFNGSHNSNGGFREILFKTNPATNDWIPSFEDHQAGYVSSKPNRSESC
ncbi:maternal effect [Abeliophyllum distichum]|uniref:Maternal effect n=1 Tax=Abeliophyllum distichum TaxID=126358 RepID=A0ABD1V3C2_9LAMI